MCAAVVGAVALHGGLEVPARSVELTTPEGGDAEHVRGLHQEHAIGVARAARLQLLAGPAGGLEVVPTEAGERERAQERRRRLDGELPREVERALLHLHDALRRVPLHRDRKSTRLNSSHGSISYAVFCLKKK